MGQASQGVSTTHVFSRAPDTGGVDTNTGDATTQDTSTGDTGTHDYIGSWYGEEVITDGSGNVYYTGYLTDDARVDFGCGPIVNDTGSHEDAFLLKFDSQGNCLWQEVLQSDATGFYNQRTGFISRDITFSHQGNVIWLYSIHDDEPGYNYYNIYPGLKEISPSEQVVWSDVISHDPPTDTEVVLEAVGATEGRVYAAGRSDFNIGPLVIAAWGELNGNTRSRKWSRDFGGLSRTNGQKVQDLAVDPASDPEVIGDAVIVGNYDFEHYHLDGTQADTAKNSNLFIQTVDEHGNSVSQWATSSGTGTRREPHDTEVAKAVDFAPDGTLYIGGFFQGYLNPELELGGGSIGYMPTDQPAQTNPIDGDLFIVKFNTISGLPNKQMAGSAVAGYASRWYESSPQGQLLIDDERLNDLEAGPTWVGFTGTACDANSECSYDDAFFDIFGRNQFPNSGTAYSLITRTFSTTDEAFIGSYISVDTANENVIFGGLNTDTDYTSLGGPQLPGGYYYLASYDIVP